MRTCPKCGYRDPAMDVPDTRKRDRAAYMREYRAGKKKPKRPKRAAPA